MGGTMKGAHGNIHAAYSRRKWSNVYVVMVVVCSVFGCLILGLMGMHRLRERRSLNLIINEKDDQILSLHRLLQKERGRAEEAKKKTEEMRTKMMNLGSEKADLSTRISEMQSTIASLREEQRAVESAFQEKQNEANSMREKYEQVEALKEELRRKEGEIEELKLRLQLRDAEVRSAGENQFSNATSEASAIESETKKEENVLGEHESTAATGAEAIQTSAGNGGANAGEEAEPKSKKEGEGEDSGKDEQSQSHSNDNQETGVRQGWKKMEVEESPRRFRGRRGYLRRAKAKRWRLISKNIEGKRTPPSNEASTTADQGSFVEDSSQSQGTEDSRHNALRNSSSETTTHPSLEELAKNSALKMDDVKQTDETEHSEEQISIKKPAEDENEKHDTHSEEQISIKKLAEDENEKHDTHSEEQISIKKLTEDENEKHGTDLPVQKEASGRSKEEQDAALTTDSEESDSKEETEDPDF